MARRVTSFQGQTGNPHFSPDGKWIAFSGEYAGNNDVYVVPSEGGEPKRLTWHPGSDVVQGWTPDGRAGDVLVLARDLGPSGAPRFWTVPASAESRNRWRYPELIKARSRPMVCGALRPRSCSSVGRHAKPSARSCLDKLGGKTPSVPRLRPKRARSRNGRAARGPGRARGREHHRSSIWSPALNDIAAGVPWSNAFGSPPSDGTT